MTSLQFSISRFKYAPDEPYDSMEAALTAKGKPEWISLTAHSSLFLAIDKSPSKILMKCLDGQDVRSTWDLSAIKLDSLQDPSQHVVIVKFPQVCLRWFARQEKVLRRIQFRLTHQREFSGLVNFFIEHFRGVRDLQEAPRSSSGFNSLSSAGGELSSSQTLMSQVGMSSQTVGVSIGGGGGSMSPPRWIQKDKAPRTVSRTLAERDNVAQTEESGAQVEPEKREEEKFELTERIMLELIKDDSFMKEVECIAEIWHRMGLDRRLFCDV